MWYFGYNGTKSAIGCVVSSDGVTWSRASGVDATDACFEGALGTSVIKMPNQYKMWYCDGESNTVNLAFSNYETGIERSEDQTGVKTFKLEQNYPNPFNPLTTIEYSIPIKTYINNSVYNSKGQKVTVLYNAINEKGKYEINWNASSCPSDLYFILLEAGHFRQVQKCVLMK